MWVPTVFLWCFSYLVVISYSKKAPFIIPCKWDDRNCLRTSTQIAIPHFADGLPEFGMKPLDPLYLGTIAVNQPKLTIVFKNVVYSGNRNCKVLDVERNVIEKWLTVTTECPVEISGHYTASGELFSVPNEGDGPFYIKADKMYFAIKVYFDTIIGADGLIYWKPIKSNHVFDVKEKPLMNFENIFNGDMKKAAPVLKVLDEKWKPIVQLVGKQIIDAMVDRTNMQLKKFVEHVPAKELEL